MHFETWQQNGDIKSTVNIPDLTWHYQQTYWFRHVDTRLAQNVRVICRLVAHVLVKGLTQPYPGTCSTLLAKTFQSRNPDCDTCLASYEEEYYGLVAHDTFTIIDATEYEALCDLTLYCSGLPINMIPSLNMSKLEHAPILTTCQWYLGMLNWLMISTPLDLMTAYSLLAITTASPTQGHLDMIWYIGQYIKAMAVYGMSFSSCANDSLEGFITFPLDNDDPDAVTNSICQFQLGTPRCLSTISEKPSQGNSQWDPFHRWAHIFPLGDSDGPLGIYRARPRSSIGFLTPSSLLFNHFFSCDKWEQWCVLTSFLLQQLA